MMKNKKVIIWTIVGVAIILIIVGAINSDKEINVGALDISNTQLLAQTSGTNYTYVPIGGGTNYSGGLTNSGSFTNSGTVFISGVKQVGTGLTNVVSGVAKTGKAVGVGIWNFFKKQ